MILQYRNIVSICSKNVFIFHLYTFLGGIQKTVKIQTENGQIELSNEVIATVVGGAVLQITMVLLVYKAAIKLGDNFNEIFEERKLHCGVVIRQEDDGKSSDV